GDGYINVIEDIGLTDPYVGKTDLVSGESAEDLTYYFAVSEQLPPSVALGVLMEENNTVQYGGGFVIQLIPYSSEEVIAALETKIAQFTSGTNNLDHGKMLEDIMEDLLGDLGMTIYDKVPTKFYCN